MPCKAVIFDMFGTLVQNLGTDFTDLLEQTGVLAALAGEQAERFKRLVFAMWRAVTRSKILLAYKEWRCLCFPRCAAQCATSVCIPEAAGLNLRPRECREAKRARPVKV